MAALIAPAAAFLAAAADGHPFAARKAAEPAPGDVAPCCMEIVAAPSAPSAVHRVASAAPAEPVAASRLRVVEPPRLLPVGVASERGLQVKTIMAARSISAAFPEILDIGGVRPDPLPWHPHGLAIDVMIPNPGTAAGIALGDQIVAYALKNADRFGLQDAIWRGVYYTPSGSRAGGYGHYDHVHITTTGGGYPSGGETYLR
jgi:hypothetical protein